MPQRWMRQGLERGLGDEDKMNGKNLEEELCEMKSSIIEYVHDYRNKNNVIPTHGYKPEPSCIAFGEFHNLLWCQLIPTTDGDGGWHEIDDYEICKGVYSYIQRERE